jgi:hypothetical protein
VFASGLSVTLDHLIDRIGRRDAARHGTRGEAADAGNAGAGRNGSENAAASYRYACL